MKHNLTYLIISCIIFAGPLCSAMESTQQKDLIKEITILKQPRFVKFLKKNKVVIAGEDGCYIVEPLTNKKIKRITTSPCSDLIIHPNKQKIALFSDKTLTIYDTKTYKQEWSLKKYTEFQWAIFNPKNPTILVKFFNGWNNYIGIYDYQKNKKDDSNQYSKKYMRKIYTFYKNSDLKIVKCNELLFFSTNLKNFNIRNCIDTQTCNNKLILAGLFKPSLTESTYFLRYWNTKTQELIYEVPLLGCKNCYSFSLSPDKKQVVIASDNKCITLNVPWEVVQVNKLFTYWALRNYQITLPQEIILLLMTAQLTTTRKI